jgi:hypothetical protein
MRRFISFAAVMLVCAAAYAQHCSVSAETKQEPVKGKTVQVDRDDDGAIDGVDLYDDDGRVVRRGYDHNRDGVMDSWQSYDPNTGLPNVVESDTRGELR